MLDFFIVGDLVFPFEILLRFCIPFRIDAQEPYITGFLLNLHFTATVKGSLLFHVGSADAFLSIIILLRFSTSALSPYELTYVLQHSP